MKKSSSNRRKTKRQKYLANLAETDPEMFQKKWAKRIKSWSKEAKRRAGLLRDKNGNPVPTSFELVDQALKELRACGENAVNLEEVHTKEFMTNTCCSAVASATSNPHLFRFNNAKKNYGAMKLGIAKVPR